ncbi:hypothetical protein F4780DRAFT_545948 [Xylariomycetidae sp. FL0641]|nr:hypothetical protein F4780DRAFT_545948 [Xylariomycetidae sp. FL0641]
MWIQGPREHRWTRRDRKASCCSTAASIGIGSSTAVPGSLWLINVTACVSHSLLTLVEGSDRAVGLPMPFKSSKDSFSTEFLRLSGPNYLSSCPNPLPCWAWLSARDLPCLVYCHHVPVLSLIQQQSRKRPSGTDRVTNFSPCPPPWYPKFSFSGARPLRRIRVASRSGRGQLGRPKRLRLSHPTGHDQSSGYKILSTGSIATTSVEWLT